MKVTICEMDEDESEFSKDWELLKAHLATHSSELLLLPEMPFCSWIASELPVSASTKRKAVEKHQQWIKWFDELARMIRGFILSGFSGQTISTIDFGFVPHPKKRNL